ncbi:fumarylacetoacetate hydrolase family protein [bacterium]|nr:fumarylacetoacetate hydrolase family protein [bacterium]
MKRNGKNFSLNVEGLTPLLPLMPGKIICIARNWAAHAKEGGHETPENPVYFAKTDNTAIGYGETIPLPQGLGRVDHEGELGVVILKQAKKVKAADAGKFIFGYTIVNDVTARAFQKELAATGRPWYAAKSMDGFAPIGPAIVLRNEAEPIDGKRIKVTVNNEIRQDGTVDDMIFKVPELIEAITKHVTLNPGDIIATGTPAGVGELHEGDEVAVEIDGIGRLVNPVKMAFY